jgi:CDP-diacylglycerol--glycerol-3-phosphate 3-phosphatidyltransferase
MLSNLIEDWARGIARQVGRFVAKSRLSPNALTIIGFLLNFPAAYILAQGQSWSWWVGGVLVLFAGAFDMLDGAVAKVTGKTTKFGAFLDSTLDRGSEVVVFLGLLLYFRSGPATDQYYGSILVYIAIAGSLLVSYVKARAEGLGMECKGVGLLPRPERVLMIVAGCIVNVWWDLALIVVLWILAIGTNVTAIQRIWYVYTTAKKQDLAAAEATRAAQAQLQPVKPAPVASPTREVKETPQEDAGQEELARKGWLFRRAGGGGR